MTLENELNQLNDQLESKLKGVEYELSVVDGSDRFTCDSLQEQTLDMLVVGREIADHDTLERINKVHHTLARMLQVD